MSKTVLLSGCNGQDGSYLADFLLEKDYEVYGIIRRVSTPNIGNIKHNLNNPHFHLIDGDLTDLPSLVDAFKISMPDEAYNLAAMSFVGSSWAQPVLSANVTGVGALNFFEAARLVKPDTKVYQASTSEQFSGEVYPQNETTSFHPKSPYGVSKLFAHEMARIYRESYDMFISCGILFNHESPRRGIEFVTQKIVDSAVRQIIGKENFILKLGNLESRRDWSHAKDFVRGMWMMLQQNTPDDFVLSSGKTHSIKEFIDLTYAYLNKSIYWQEENCHPVGLDPYDWNILVQSVSEFYRPSEVWTLQGDSSKARKVLNWVPEYSFQDLLKDMIESKICEVKANISR